jgi:hypothetical protein
MQTAIQVPGGVQTYDSNGLGNMRLYMLYSMQQQELAFIFRPNENICNISYYQLIIISEFGPWRSSFLLCHHSSPDHLKLF